mmetsp:Transcript_65344/g.188237  ORF Transcript_65344/g.188237 Transcript_65344/m.188237 type:complete len:200 (-) Transcript_65344:355-954(-)
MLICGTCPSLIANLKPFKASRNFSGALIILTAPFQDRSLTKFFLSVSTLGSTPAIKCMAAKHTSSTPAGGFAKAFNSWKSFLSRTSKAASACCTKGSAAARSLSQLSCCTATSAAIFLHCFASMAALSLSSCTLAFSRPTSSAKMSAAAAFSCTTTAFSLRTSSRAATSSWVVLSFVKPLVKRSFWSSNWSTFCPTMVV